MKQLIFSILLTATLQIDTKAQGCVAIKSTGNLCTAFQNSEKGQDKTAWSFSFNNRYYRSFRHFIGSNEQKQRVQMGTQVINYSYTADLTLQYHDQRWSVALNLPVLSNTRSSLYEHDGKNRHSTRSFGLGDARIAVYSWLLDPVAHHKGNIQAGIGIKLPTGDYRYQDRFYSNDTTRIMGPVDQSIQLGDGGTGFTAEANAYLNLSSGAQLYGNFYYLLNPREQNGVSTSRGRAASASSIANGSDIMSVADQYMIRTGISYKIKKVSISAGLRDECLPVHDLIGGSNGFRRPGYIISAEPGISLISKKMMVYAALPIAIVRNRMQSVPDKIRTSLTGVYTKGDAAFADRSLYIGCTWKF